MEIRTLCDILTGLERAGRKPDLLKFKSEGSWRGIPAEEFVSTVRDLALGLTSLGVQPGDRVAILSENRPEWAAFDHAILNVGAVVVPLYPNLQSEQVRYILEHSQARVLILSTGAQLEKLLPVLPSLPSLDRIVVMDPPPQLPPRVVPWTALLREGERVHATSPGLFEEGRSPITPDHLASILYTSGTTGEPKGVMLTQGNFASNVSATMKVIPITEGDVTLSFLPLSHAFERILEFAHLAAGATVAYAESLEAVPRNLVEVEATIVATVPRLLEKIHARVAETVRTSSWHRRLLFTAALRVGLRRCRAVLAGRPVPWRIRALHPFAERRVHSPLRERIFGPRIRFVISGSAPLSPAICEFFHAIGVPVLEGYGLTETSPVVSVNTLTRTRIGTVGEVIPGVEVRIAEDGEVLVRGPNVMQGYYRNEEATRAALVGGWLHTGDIGVLDADGHLRITDRKKEILKTSGGKMVAPQPIENLLKDDPAVAQAVLIGDRRKFVSALLVPDFDWLTAHARRNGIPFRDPTDLLEEPRVLDLYRRVIAERMDSLPPYEQIKRFRLLPKELTMEAGELTPTLKLKRRVIDEKYAELIESMYQE